MRRVAETTEGTIYDIHTCNARRVLRLRDVAQQPQSGLIVTGIACHKIGMKKTVLRRLQGAPPTAQLCSGASTAANHLPRNEGLMIHGFHHAKTMACDCLARNTTSTKRACLGPDLLPFLPLRRLAAATLRQRPVPLRRHEVALRALHLELSLCWSNACLNFHHFDSQSAGNLERGMCTTTVYRRLFEIFMILLCTANVATLLRFIPAVDPRLFEIASTLTFRALHRNRIVSIPFETIVKRKTETWKISCINRYTNITRKQQKVTNRQTDGQPHMHPPRALYNNSILYSWADDQRRTTKTSGKLTKTTQKTNFIMTVLCVPVLCCVRAVCLSSCENRPQHTAPEPQTHQKIRTAQNS